MSFDLAVWFLDSGELVPPSPRIADYVDGLLARWPDIGTDAEVDSPWSDGPLLGNASGRLFYFGMTYSSSSDLLREAIDYAVALAAERKLVCYDPQHGTLR